MKLPDIDHPVFVFKLSDEIEPKTADYLEFALQYICHNVAACHGAGGNLSYLLGKAVQEVNNGKMYQCSLTAYTEANNRGPKPVYHPYLSLLIASIHEYPIDAAYQALKAQFQNNKAFKGIKVEWED